MELSKAEIIERIAELAFSGPNDAVRLALNPDAGTGELDLRLISQIKRGKDSTEIKLLDREELLKLLIELTEPAREGRDDSQREFYEALNRAASQARAADGDEV